MFKKITVEISSTESKEIYINPNLLSHGYTETGPDKVVFYINDAKWVFVGTIAQFKIAIGI